MKTSRRVSIAHPTTDTIETIIPGEIMKESAFYQHIVNKARAEGFAEGFAKGFAEGFAKSFVEGFAKGLLVLIRKRFTSIPRTISSKIKSIHDKDTLLNIQKMAINAKTKKEFVESFNALNI